MRCLRRGRVRSTDTACRRRNLRSFSLVRSLSFVLSRSFSLSLVRSFSLVRSSVAMARFLSLGVPATTVASDRRGEALRGRAKAPLPLPPRRLLAGDVEVRPEEVWRNGHGGMDEGVAAAAFRAAVASFAPPRRVSRRRGVFRAAAACFVAPVPTPTEPPTERPTPPADPFRRVGLRRFQRADDEGGSLHGQ